MTSKFAAIGVLLLFAGPAAAEADWEPFFNMGTFAGGGGDATSGSLWLECAPHDGVLTSVDMLFLTLGTAAGVVLSKKNFREDFVFTIAEETVTLPMTRTDEDTADFVQGADTAAAALKLVSALRRGSLVSVANGDVEVARIPLKGSSDTLEPIEDCLKGEISMN